MQPVFLRRTNVDDSAIVPARKVLVQVVTASGRENAASGMQAGIVASEKTRGRGDASCACA
jgi:hypothetical protein